MGMKGAAIKQCVSTMATSVTMIEKKVEFLKGNKEVLVALWGQEHTNDRQIAHLMTMLLDDCKLGVENLTVKDDTVDEINNNDDDNDE